MTTGWIARIAAVALATALAGCGEFGTRGDSGAPAAAAPSLQVGTRWVYRAREGFRLPDVWEETREVTGTGKDGLSVRVTLHGPRTDIEHRELWVSPGMVRVGALMDTETRRFATPLERYRFPLTPGESWNQWVDNFNEATHADGQINRYVRVGGWEKVSTPAGVFDAIRMRVLMRLDDENYYRYATTCNYVIWYAPAVGAPVREEKDAGYVERGETKDGAGDVHTQHTLLELVSYTPGRS